MTKGIVAVLLMAALMTCSTTPLVTAGGLQVNSELLAGLALQVPESPADREYLGLVNKPQFKLSDIKATAVLVELFSMYCPVCQAEAPVINELFELIQQRPELKTGLKVLGVGIQNTPFEVGVFRKKYAVRFPLIPDEDMAFRSVCGADIRTPSFVLVTLKDKLRVAATHVGKIHDAKAFLDTISREITTR